MNQRPFFCLRVTSTRVTLYRDDGTYLPIASSARTKSGKLRKGWMHWYLGTFDLVNAAEAIIANKDQHYYLAALI